MISIIIPFYNTEKYLEICLSSIKAQTFSDYECLLIDDGSTDSSREIAQKYVNEDSRFILLNKEHIGFPASKNLGLDNARGEYICFIDSDDWVEKFYLENLYNALISTGSDISNSECFFEKDGNESVGSDSYSIDYKVYDNTESILTKYFHDTHCWNKLFKKELFNGLRFREDVEALSDTLLNHLLFEKANKTVYTKYRGYHYRIHNENMTYKVRNNSSTYWAYRVNVYIEVCSYISKYPNLKKLAINTMKSQFEFCLPHLTENEITEFKKNTILQNLLKGK